tara:strand:+ start:808 stop:1182 length:375 start_codon:yes stop_codon:yes gene_type:complete
MARPKKGELEDRKQQYGMWLGIPILARKDDEKTQTQICAKLNISENTARKWRSEPFIQEIARNAFKILGGNDMAAVTRAIVDGALEGSPSMARLYMEWQGEVGMRKDVSKTPTGFSVKFTTDEK